MYNQWLDKYANEGFQKVEGWVDGRMLEILKILHAVQERLGVRGGVMEIGVHHGRFFLALNGMVAPGEGQSFAIDLFEDQSLNIDSSGCGSISIFVNNLKSYDRHGGNNVVTIQTDSTRLRHDATARFRTDPPKIISIDGGHTVEHTISDLMFAESIVHSSGAIILDDILNSHWIGVIEGLITYLQRRPTLWPVFIGYNKLILVPMSVHHEILGTLQHELPSDLPLGKVVEICGYSLLALIG